MNYGKFILEKALIEGDFRLCSGGRSKYLIDLAKLLRTNEGQYMAKDIDLPFLNYDIMGGPLSAADLMCPPLGADKWFGVRKEPKNRGTDQGRITGNLEKGQRVLMVEDVCTTGGTLFRAIQAVIEFGAIPIAAFCIIERPEWGGMKGIAAQYKIPTFAAYTFIQDPLTMQKNLK